MAAVEVTQVLLSAQSPDAAIRTQAEEQLKAFQEQNFPGFVASLSSELVNHAKPADSRRLAGLILKNMLDAKDDVRKRELHSRWVALDPALKQHLRDATLATLSSDAVDVRHTAAMVVAKVAAIDLPRKEWPTLIQSLLTSMNVQPPNTGLRQATLEAMGYVCEEMAQIKEEVLAPAEINMILTAVVQGMGPTEPNESRLAATVALCNAIEFAEHNFEVDNERNYLMQVVCQGTQSPEIRIRVASFECLHEIAAMYYSKLTPYMTEIYNITVKALKEDQEEVALQALEFWSTVCDTEFDLMEEEDAKNPPLNFMRAAAPHLVPILLESLTKQEEGQEQDDSTWNISVAAGTCLGLAARVVQDDMVGMVMPFVQANVSKNTGPEDWRLREAATFAFGLILDGPAPAKLLDMVKQALGFLLTALKQDPNPHVKDTTAWTIGRIFEFLHSNDVEPPVITRETLPPVIQVLTDALKDEPHIVYRACGAISQLASGFKNSEGGTSPMSPFFKDVIAALLQCAQRFAHHEHSRIQISAFEAINDLVRSASHDTLDVVAQLITVVLQAIHKTFEQPATSAEAQEKQSEVQGQLCGVLQVILQKLSEQEDTKAHVVPYADGIMETLLRIFSNRSATVLEEAMLAVGSFTYVVGREFIKYLQAFYPYLRMGLTNYQEWQVCLSSVGTLGDICRNVEASIAPFCDEIMSILIQNLGREDVHRTIKPQILSAFGDIALVLGEAFEKYLEPVLRVLKQAAELSIQSAIAGDEDYVDYNNELRHGILAAYSGIMQGLGPQKCEQYMRGEVPVLVGFVDSIGSEQEPDDEVARSALSLLGDMCSLLTNLSGALGQTMGWRQLVNSMREASSDMPDEQVQWAIAQIDAAVGRA